MDRYFTEELARLTEAGLRRSLRLVEGPQGPKATIDGKEAILLCSNDYLGLANHPLVKRAAKEAVDAWGVGAGASRLVSGNMTPHARLEERIMRFKGTEAALVFNSGYHANVGCITAICQRDSEVFSDRLNHASIVDACLLSRAAFRRYPHRDVDSLERLLKKSRARRKLIATDGVFSMDGDIAPIREIAGLLDRHNAMLLIDDAHSTGVLGHRGTGTLEHLGVSHPSIIQMGTLGKAVGAFGAFIAGSVELIEILKSKSRPFIYTTALPPSICAASIKALDVMEGEPGLRERLWENAAFLREGLKEAGLDTLGSRTQIMPIAVGQAQRTMELSSRLLEKGVFIQGIRPPTVPDGTSRLRVSVTAGHSREDLASALAAIRAVFE